MTEIRDELAEAVARGAAWLDTEVPDWRARIDVETLNLASPTRCVAGQVFEAEAAIHRANGRNAELGSGYQVMYNMARDVENRGGARVDVYFGFTHPVIDSGGLDNPYTWFEQDAETEPVALAHLHALWVAAITTGTP